MTPPIDALSRFTLTLFAAPGAAVAPAAVIPVLHRWIRERTVPGLLIDVADYAHLPDDPRVLLVAHEAHYALAAGAGARPALSYTRLRPADGPLADRLAAAARALVTAARGLENAPELTGGVAGQDGGDAGQGAADGLIFDAGAIAVAANDRLLAPPTPDTAAALRPAVETLAARLFDGAAVLAPLDDPDRPGFTLRAAGPVTLETLAARLA